MVPFYKLQDRERHEREQVNFSPANMNSHSLEMQCGRPYAVPYLCTAQLISKITRM